MGRPVRGSILLFVGCFSCCFIRFCLFGFGCVPFSASASAPSLLFLFSVLLFRLAGWVFSVVGVFFAGVVAFRLAALVFRVSAFRVRGFVFLRPLFPLCGAAVSFFPFSPLLFLGGVVLFSRFGCFSPLTRKQKPLEVFPAWRRRLSHRRSPRDHRQS